MENYFGEVVVEGSPTELAVSGDRRKTDLNYHLEIESGRVSDG